jgi:adenylate kinase family enzyme
VFRLYGRIFAHGQVDPFFSDRLFANRFVNLFNTLDKGSTQNKIYVFRGPPGSGKSTFLNCFTNKVQQYVNEGNGTMYEVVWKLNNKLTIPCPSHDNPLLLIPRDKRKEVISELLKDNKELRDEIFNKKKYEWIFTTNPCTFCSSISQSLADKHGDILPYLYVRQYRISKNLSEGISVFNDNDELPKFKAQPTEKIQEKLDEYFEEEGGGVKIDHSIYAKSNNGIYALMDLKDNNHYRFIGLRGIVSEGRHKVKTIEEKVKSIFLIVTNPEDEKEIIDSAMEDRKRVTKMNYVLVPKTQNKIFYKIYGEDKKEHFHPNVVDMFSRVLISTRMDRKRDDNVTLTWVDNSNSYSDICDDDLLILRQEVYNGIIPEWLSETDVQNFVYDIRKGIINMALNDGEEGISDRKAIEVFGNLLNYYKDDEYIGIKRVKNYFERVDTSLLEYIPKGFLDAIERYYTYIISQEVKESLFIRNDEKIIKDLKNYLFSLNFSIGDRLTNPHTNDTFIVSDELFRKVENPVFGTSNEHIRNKVFKRYISETVCCENIEESSQFKKLYQDYVYGLKEHILKEFIGSKNFINAIKDYDTSYFNSYDNKIRRNVNNLIENMISNYGYTIKAAKEVCTYLFDKLE